MEDNNPAILISPTGLTVSRTWQKCILSIQVSYVFLKDEEFSLNSTWHLPKNVSCWKTIYFNEANNNGKVDIKVSFGKAEKRDQPKTHFLFCYHSMQVNLRKANLYKTVATGMKFHCCMHFVTKSTKKEQNRTENCNLIKVACSEERCATECN